MRTQKITYGATTIAFTLPARPWVPGTIGVGAGIEWSAAGIPAAWVTRRDRALRFVQRFLESEWPAFRAFLEYAQEGGNFSWFPDAGSSTSYLCYLVTPTIDEDVRPTPGDYFGSLELPLTIRQTNGSAIDEVYFDG